MTLLDRAADKMREMFPTLPYIIRFSYRGAGSTVGSGPERFALEFHDESGLQDLARGDLASLLDRYVAGRVDFHGDMYAFVGARKYVARDALWRVHWTRRLRFALGYLVPSSVRRKLVSVSSHYDLPGEFILSYLDTRTRAYSCAIWDDPARVAEPDDEALEDAQYRKFRSAAEELQLQPDDKFLDIGCGYGYMVRLAESEFGCRDTLGITLSENQIEQGYSRNLKRLHYMDLPEEGRYDKIYTCGMISHLDRSELEQYYRRVWGLLKSGGLFWAHAIIPHGNPHGLTNYNTLSGTFSQKYVFPDHFQFPIHAHLKVLERIGFLVRRIHFRYGHYAKTLRHWYRRYVVNLPRTRHLITPRIERAWHLYLTYGTVMDGPQSVLKQILLQKP